MSPRTGLALALLGALVAASAVTACGGGKATRQVGKRVDGELVAELPAEARRWAYEAENEIIISLDRLDARRNALAAAKADLALGEKALDTASTRGTGQEPAKARIEWLEERVDAGEVEVDAAELAVFCARTNLELTRAKAAVRFGLPVEEGFVEGFEKEYASCALDEEEAKKEVLEAGATVAKAKEAWRKARIEFAQKSQDYNHGLWID